MPSVLTIVRELDFFGVTSFVCELSVRELLAVEMPVSGALVRKQGLSVR